MNIRAFALSLGFGGVILATNHAWGQETRQCAERRAVVAELADKYGEQRQSIGLTSDQGLVEVFASARTGTWTITVTLANGMTCLVAAGESYERITEAPVPGGSPA